MCDNSKYGNIFALVRNILKKKYWRSDGHSGPCQDPWRYCSHGQTAWRHGSTKATSYLFSSGVAIAGASLIH